MNFLIRFPATIMKKEIFVSVKRKTRTDSLQWRQDFLFLFISLSKVSPNHKSTGTASQKKRPCYIEINVFLGDKPTTIPSYLISSGGQVDSDSD